MQARLRWFRVLLVAVLFVLGGGTTTASAATFTYDVFIVARFEIHQIEDGEAAPALPGDARDESAVLSAEARGSSTTPIARSVATKLSGSVPVPGVLEASPRVKGVGAINNWNGKPVEFVFDPGTGTFAMGKPAASAGMKGSPHQQLVAAIDADARTVVGGIVQRADNGLLTFDEMSGHYWQNWNADVRQQFIDTLTGYGIGVG